MACKYKYNNNWYSKEELQSILYKERGIDKYGKLVKPEIKQTNSNANNLVELQNKLRELEEQEQDLFSTSDYESIDSIYAEKLRNQIAEVNKQIQNLKNTKSVGIQPTQTNETLKESIDSVKEKLNENNLQAEDMPFAPKEQRKEYTSQALINTKIAALKEVAKKYPRSLIRSEVKRINTSSSQELYDQFGADELPFQKIPNNTEKNIIFVTKEDLNKLDKKEPC